MIVIVLFVVHNFSISFTKFFYKDDFVILQCALAAIVTSAVMGLVSVYLYFSKVNFLFPRIMYELMLTF